jgi:hypothetical protein
MKKRTAKRPMVNPKSATWLDLIGLKVVALRGFKSGRREKIVLQWVLFDDGETFLVLEEQCPITYHDCDMSARSVMVTREKTLWKEMLDKMQHKGVGYDEPTDTGSFPFSRC